MIPESNSSKAAIRSTVWRRSSDDLTHGAATELKLFLDGLEWSSRTQMSIRVQIARIGVKDLISDAYIHNIR